MQAIPSRSEHFVSAARRLCLLPLLLATFTAPAVANDDAQSRQYTFSWRFLEGSDMAPRGGTTKGPALTLDQDPSAPWLALQQPRLSNRERDRRAILAMAGPYRASFDFIETIDFQAPGKPAQPYQSWGTEHVYVLSDEPEFVSLQHVLVMRVAQEDGTLTEPMVVKHWRQDWRYQDRDLHVFRGERRWERVRLSRREAQGQWTQAVYQVDDSPRYEASGRWTHDANVSTWLSGETWRPLPRREFSVRDDYQVLIGTNRHTITPTGWVHEENNRKVVLSADGNPAQTLAKETGLNRYQRIKGYDFGAGDAYLAKTASYWQAVRETWTDIYRQHDFFTLAEQVNSQPLFMAMFTQAEEIASVAATSDELQPAVRAALMPYLQPGR